MDKFEEYKFFADSTQHLSERRQTTTGTYLTVNTAIVAVLGLLVKDAGLRGWELVLIGAPLFLVGILACLIWREILARYEVMSGWRYEQLQEMERAPEMTGSHQFYIKEWESFYRPRQGQKMETFSFAQLEGALCLLFLGLYVVYGLVLVLSAAMGWW